MKNLKITKAQARKYMLLKHGLYGDYKFKGEEGVLQYIKQAGCIQYDPIDICGKNHELVLQSRVNGFNIQMLYRLLYESRDLIDYWDKNMSIFSVTDWPYFERIREKSKLNERCKDEIDAISNDIFQTIRKKGPVCSSDLQYKTVVNWSWAPTKLSRAALETLYFRGDLIVHHKKNILKYYDLTENQIPGDILDTPDPNSTAQQYYRWYVLRRIGAVGLLWNKSGDAWLGISGFKSPQRIEAFESVLKDKKITCVEIEDINTPFFIKSEDKIIIDKAVKEDSVSNRMEFIAPLDNIMWDRRIINALFDFDYKWEIYTPAAKRKYGYYVLPILHGDRFVGRIEILRDRKQKLLAVKNLWWEENIKVTKRLQKVLDKCLQKFAKLHECSASIQI